MHSCRLPRNKWKKLGINRDIGIHWQSPQKLCPVFLQVQRQVGKSFYGTVIWESWRSFSVSTADKTKEVPRFNSRGRWKHHKGRHRKLLPQQFTNQTHQRSVDFLLRVCVCNSIALWQICGEKPWFSRQLLTCCFPKKRPLGFLVETLLATAALILHPHPFNMGISFVLPAYGLPGPHRRCHPRRCGISQLIVRTQLIFRPLLGP